MGFMLVKNARKQGWVAWGLMDFLAQATTAQFAGKLTYKIVTPNNMLTITYWQNGTSAKIAARSVAGSDSTHVTNTQDTLLYDIQGLKTTHLVYRTGRAVIMPNSGELTQQVIARSRGQQNIAVQTTGAETVNGYVCTHYVITTGAGNYITKRDVWVTKNLGSPGVQVVGEYLYYTPDFPAAVKLLAAGGSGVVVKSVTATPWLTTTMNLVAVDTTAPPASFFAVPGWYTVSDKSQMSLPKQ